MTLERISLVVALLASGCGVGNLKDLPNAHVSGSLRGINITYDGSTDPKRCVPTMGLTAEEDGQPMAAQPGQIGQQCDAAGPAETCGHSHDICLTPGFSLSGAVDDASSSTIQVHDGSQTWTITVPRGGTVELEGAPTDGGPLQVGDALAVHCAPGSGQVVGAYLAFTETGAEEHVATTDPVVDGGVVTFTISGGQLLDSETRGVQVVCDIHFAPTVCDGPASCDLTGPLRGATVPMFFPQL